MPTQSAASAVATSRSVETEPQLTEQELSRAVNDPALGRATLARSEARAGKLCSTLAADPSTSGGQRAVDTYWQTVLADGRDLRKSFPQHNNYLRHVDWQARRAQQALSPAHFRKQCALGQK